MVPNEKKKSTVKKATHKLLNLPKKNKSDLKELIFHQWKSLTEENQKASSSYQNELFEEYLKFLTILIENYGDKEDGKFCPSMKIDQVWHSHIVCTREYAAFCQSFGPNGEFIHHTPSSKDTSSHEQYVATLSKYTEMGFGDAVKDHPTCWEAATSNKKKNRKRSIVDLTAENDDDDEENDDEDDDEEDDDDDNAEEDAEENDENSPANKVNIITGPAGKRHFETLAKLRKWKIPSSTVPYSTRNKDGTWKFTGFECAVAFGPGSGSNAIYHCSKCNQIWEYMRTDVSTRNCVFCAAKKTKQVIEVCGCC